jgi:hypothetical protein
VTSGSDLNLSHRPSHGDGHCDTAPGPPGPAAAARGSPCRAVSSPSQTRAESTIPSAWAIIVSSLPVSRSSIVATARGQSRALAGSAACWARAGQPLTRSCGSGRRSGRNKVFTRPKKILTPWFTINKNQSLHVHHLYQNHVADDSSMGLVYVRNYRSWLS